MSPELSASIFQAPRPAAGPGEYRGQLLASGQFAIYRINSVTQGKPEFFSQEARDARKEELAARLGGAQLTGIVETLYKDASVSIAPTLLENELSLQ